MKPADIDRVFGRGRLRMVTGDHVEVFREQSLPGERRRYTKRFLATAAGDFSEWTEREWRILARLVGHGIKPVPDVVRFDRGAADRAALVQTYDAGVTVDHWATLLPVERDGTHLRNVFEDCAHWWALARHSLIALDAIHDLHLVHLDLKADNVCIPVAPAEFDPHARGQLLQPRFEDIALIDFAFSLVSGERLVSALPIAQQADYEYQSPRLLHALEAGRQGDLAPTRQLDWRCDLFSLAAMLWRYLPEFEGTTTGAWTRPRHAKARALVRRLIEAHDAELPATRPHAELIAFADEALAQPTLSESLQRGWTLAVESGAAAAASPTPVTRIALPVTAPVATMAAATAAAAIAHAKSAAAATPTPPATPTTRPAPLQAAMQAAPRPAATHEAAAHAARRAAESGAASEGMAVDPTDVALRVRARQSRREARARRLAWTGAIATAAVLATAAAAWLEPAWRPSARDLHVAVAPAAMPSRHETPRASEGTTPRPTLPGPPTAAAARNASPASAAAPNEAAAVAAAPRETVVPATAPHEVTVPATAPSKSTASVAAVPAPTPAPATAARRGRAVEPAPARPTLARNARPALPFPAPSRAARGSAATAVAAARTGAARPARLALATSSPRRPASANPWPASGATIPWAVAGRAAPRATLVTAGAGERGALVPSPAALAAIAASASRAPTPFVNVNATAAPSGADAAPAAPASAPTALAVVAKPSLAADAAAAQPAPQAPPPSAGGGDAASIDYSARASALMTEHVPRLAQRAERLVARVLFVAGRTEHVPGDEEIRAAASAIDRDPGDALAGLAVAPREAQRLGEAARAEYGRRGGTREALALQARAFGADPLDAETAGNLAFLLLRQRPAQPEAARQLALHALTLHGARYPQGRIEDWGTLAIASALAGRERDAKNAFLVVLSLAPNLDQQCKVALDVYAIYGERLRAPVEAMLRSASASGRTSGSPACDWPPRWVVSGANPG